LVDAVGEQAPDTWGVWVEPEHAMALCELLEEGHSIKLHDLIMNPAKGESHLAIVPIMLSRGAEKMMLPDLNTSIKLGDRILCCGQDAAKSTQKFLINDIRSMHYMVTGYEMPDTLIGRWLYKRKNKTVA